MLLVREIHKSYGKIHAVRGVSFELPARQVAGLLGPNGAGKSTVIRIVTSFIPADRGEVRIGGKDVVEESLQARRQIGYLPESAPLYPEMRVIDYLKFRATVFGLRGRARRDAAERVIGRCWLKDVRSRRIGQLSKGYRQRTGLAAALLHDPGLIILDEPSNGLDPTQIVEMRKLIRELGADRTVLVSSHILSEVERTCDRVIIVARGQVRADGSPRALLEGAGRGHRIVVEFAPGPGGTDAALAAVRAVAPAGAPEDLEGGWKRLSIHADSSSDVREALGRSLAACGAAVRELHREAATLESVFIDSLERSVS